MTTAIAPPTGADIRGAIDGLRELRPDLAASLGRLDMPEGGPHRLTLGRLLEVLDTIPATSQHAWQAAVLANMFGVVARGDAEDYVEAAHLFRSKGREVAQIQAEFEDRLGIAPSRPYASTAIIRLGRSEHVRQLLIDAGHPEDEADRIAAECADLAFWLLLTGVDSTRPVPLPDSAPQLRLVVEKRGVGVWRALLANVAANPFGPEARQLGDLARDAELPAVAQAVEACTRVYRKRFEAAERLEVAREIRKLVAISGCSQRRFATHIGTSAPRLSTYVNGLVTPSATMMVRIRRCAAELAPSPATQNRLAG